jgi:hypothetical protein
MNLFGVKINGLEVDKDLIYILTFWIFRTYQMERDICSCQDFENQIT